MGNPDKEEQETREPQSSWAQLLEKSRTQIYSRLMEYVGKEGWEGGAYEYSRWMKRIVLTS